MTIVLATRNRHKAEEIRAIAGLPCLTLHDLPDAPTLIEDADTMAGNAARKATQLASWLMTRQPSGDAPDSSRSWVVLADDSGLEVDALNGAPGVHSARFAAIEAGTVGNSSDAANNAKLLRLLEGVPWEKRTARFRCVLALVEIHWADRLAEPRLFEGVCEGRVNLAPSGQGGFGYDPLFIPTGFAESFAELGEAVKNRLSHRARALAKWREWMCDSRRGS